MEIKPPSDDVDSLGKLAEWLADCGMPQEDLRKLSDYAADEHDSARNPAEPVVYAEHEEWGLGFKFRPGDRHAANEGYRELVRFVARGLYARFLDPRYNRVIWRVRPALEESAIQTYHTHADGSAVDWDEYDGDGSDLIEHETGYSSGSIRFRVCFVMVPDDAAPE